MTTCKRVLEIAVRMEAAYRRKFSGRARFVIPDSEAFLKCSVGLISLHSRDESCPVDPELFVALQRKAEHIATAEQGNKLDRMLEFYAGRVHQMIQRLRIELVRELEHIEGLYQRGFPIDDLVLVESESVSPVGRFIFATRHKRHDLSQLILADVLRHHDACPLYRFACVSLMAPCHYPSIASLEQWLRPNSSFNPGWEVSHN